MFFVSCVSVLDGEVDQLKETIDAHCAYTLNKIYEDGNYYAPNETLLTHHIKQEKIECVKILCSSRRIDIN